MPPSPLARQIVHPSRRAAASLLAALGLSLGTACGQTHDPARHASMPAADDGRIEVIFPPVLRAHTLANMRAHLAVLGRIQLALSQSDLDLAVDLAEKQLGMSSLSLHGSHEVSRFMPPAMRESGTAMHRSASQFAVVVKDASATGDLKPALAALGRLTQTCVACHAAFRLR
ncbi:hypothetical protein ABT392_14885 [Paucibacter sp. JuS9]|uniref:hypothetical protein n=1 Tax=Paucibacter sp. JuS9 TaxID=3228748 RepID=UPI003756A158